MKRRESIPPEGRDQDPTTFAEILQELLWHEPRAAAAVLIDTEGETVDYASSLPSYYTKVAAANLRVVLDDLVRAWRKITLGDELTEAIVRAQKRTFFVRPLPDGYALVLVLRRRAFAVSSRAVTLAACRLAKEAGWPSPFEESLPWHPVEVETSRADHFRPKQMSTGDTWEAVEVLGSIVHRGGERRLGSEKGYRCRLQGGAEITLVREPTGIWFVDQPARGLSSHLGPQSAPPAGFASHAPSASSTAPPRTSGPAPSASTSRPTSTSPTSQSPSRARPPAPASEAQPGASVSGDVGTPGQTGDMWAKEAKRARKF
jgi:hypothetical protein